MSGIGSVAVVQSDSSSMTALGWLADIQEPLLTAIRIGSESAWTEHPVSPRAAVQTGQNHVKRMAAPGQKRTKKWPRADIEDPASRAGSLTGARLQSGQDRLTANATEYELVHFDFGCV